MAKISNTTVYPTVTPEDNDLLILTDANDSNKTKTVLMSGVNAYINANTYTTSVTVTSSQILNCYTQPVILIPGVAGKHVQPISMLCKYTFNTIAYNAPNDFPIGFTVALTKFWTAGIPAANIDSELKDYAFTVPIGVSSLATFGGLTAPTPIFESQYPSSAGGNPLLFSCLNANPTLGNGTLTFDIMYRLVNA